VGIILSGGNDSSAEHPLATRVAGSGVPSFTLDFKEADHSEASYARTVADRFASDHTKLLLTGAELVRSLPCALESMDQPTTDGVNTYVISRAVRKAGLKVALSGLGADELFAGYPSFRRAVHVRRLRSVPGPVRRAVSRTARFAYGCSPRMAKFCDLIQSGGSAAEVYEISRRLFRSDELECLAHSPSPHAAITGHADQSDAVNAVSRSELQGYMANTLLRDTDFMSMAHALEIRVPFVDSVLVDSMLRVPGAWKLDSARPKPLLLEALKGLLPESIWRRPKQGFVLPFKSWMHRELRPDLDRVFGSHAGWSQIGVQPAAAEFIWQDFLRAPGRRPWTHAWSLYTLNRWCELNGVTQ
jgi:asparagine synthase (glutamine-hydrolysing)